MIKRLGTVLVAGILWVGQAAASPIYYEVESLGSDRWRYSYTVGNETGAPIDWFAIYFDFGLYEFDLVTVDLGGGFFAEEVDPATYAGPDGWDILVAPPDDILGFADDGFFDAFALDDPIAPGALLGGFTIDFRYLGTGRPGSQYFKLLSLGMFDVEVIGDGFTRPLQVATVPEPGTLGLLMAGLVFGWRRRTRSGTARTA